MPEDTAVADTVQPEGTPRSVRKGDVPEAIERRYYTDVRGGRGLGFYADARIAQPAFRDEGRRLVAERADPHVARDLAAIARHRGWSMVVVQGSPAFRREAWLAARTVGIEVRGYRPTERDVQDLRRRTLEIERRARNGRERDASDPDPPAATPGSMKGQRARTSLRVIEAVVQARVADPKAQDRILAVARARLATWLERGAGPAPARTKSPGAPDREPTVRRERTRGR